MRRHVGAAAERPGRRRFGPLAGPYPPGETAPRPPRRSYTDIAIRPFQRTVDGVLFGLLVEEDEEGSWAELYPDRHCFGPPWDGTYDS